MVHLPALIPSTLTPRWIHGRARGLAMGAVMVGSGAALLHSFLATRDGAPVAAAAAPAPTAPVAVAATVPPPAVEPDAKGAIDMAPVLTDGGLRVLLRSNIEDSWVVGAAEVEVDEGVTVVTRRLNNAGLVTFGPLVGERLRLYSADGSSCLARLTGAVALGRFDDSGGEEPAKAADAWDRADGTHVVAGELEMIDGRCDEPLWARSASLPAPSMATRRDAGAGARRAAIAAFAARPEHRELTDGSGSEEYEVESLSAGDDTVLVTTLVVEGCAGKWPALSAFWRLEAGGKLAFLGAEETVTDVLAAADADGDGRMEIIAQDDLAGVTMLRRHAVGGFEVEKTARVAIHGCRC
jgi:hypothetical protein